jgi:ABC-type polysaccharide/polyol phosphate export permease
LVGATVLLGLLSWYQWRGTWSVTISSSLFALPLLLVIQLIFMCGLGLLLAMGNLFYRDIRQLAGVLIPLWMFVSGVVLPAPSCDTWAGWFLSVNPMTPLIEGIRGCVLQGCWPPISSFTHSALVASVTLILGWAAFRRYSVRFAEYI